MSDIESDITDPSHSSGEEDTVTSDSDNPDEPQLEDLQPNNESSDSDSSVDVKQELKNVKQELKKVNKNKSTLTSTTSETSEIKHKKEGQRKSKQLKAQSQSTQFDKNYEQSQGSSNSSPESESENSDSEEESEESSDEEEEIGDEEANDSSEEQLDKEYAVFRKELADLPFEDLQNLKERIGTKVFAQIMRDGKARKPSVDRPTLNQPHKTKPLELSSKKKVSVFRQSQPVKKKVFRDPRFDDLSGQYSEDYFKKNYSFLGDVKQRDKQKLIKQLRKEQDPEKKQQIASLVQRMNQQERADKQKESRSVLEKGLKQREKELVQTGKTPFFLKKSEKRKLELAEKYKELKASGSVDTYLTKKRKKNAAKERKKLPLSER